MTTACAACSPSNSTTSSATATRRRRTACCSSACSPTSSRTRRRAIATRLLAPGRRLAEELAHNYLDKPELEAIGGTLIAEVYGKQVDQAVGALLRRQRDARSGVAHLARAPRDARGGSRERVARSRADDAGRRPRRRPCAAASRSSRRSACATSTRSTTWCSRCDTRAGLPRRCARGSRPLRRAGRAYFATHGFGPLLATRPLSTSTTIAVRSRCATASSRREYAQIGAGPRAARAAGQRVGRRDRARLRTRPHARRRSRRRSSVTADRDPRSSRRTSTFHLRATCGMPQTRRGFRIVEGAIARRHRDAGR